MIFNVGEMLLQSLQWLDWWSQVFIIVGVKCRHPNIIMRVIKSCFLSFSSLLKLSYVLLWYCLNTLFGTKAPHSWKFLFFILLSLFAMIFDVGEMLLQGLQWLGWWSQVFIIVGVKWRYPKITNFRMDFCHTQINNKEVVMEI